jgi:hypothetical protein
MASQRRRLSDLLTNLAAQSGAWTAAGSLLAYVLGYVSLRSQLAALGVGTDLALVSERYLFEGCRFLFYLASTVPLAVACGLPPVVLGAFALRRAPAVAVGLRSWWSGRTGPLAVGIVFVVAVIQLALRQAFAFDNLLLRESIPEPAWFRSLLTTRTGAAAEWYFAGLLMALAISATLLAAVRPWASATPFQRASGVLLGVLLGIGIALLPVNYGVLASARALPRTGALPGAPSPAAAWLVWEGPTTATFFVRETHGGKRLTSVPRDQLPRVDIVGYDPLTVVRDGPPRPTDPPPGPQRGVWTLLGRVAGFQASALTWRGADLPGGVRGRIRIVGVDGGSTTAVTEEGDFSSPVFLQGDRQFLALLGDQLVRIDLAGGTPQELARLPEVVKLVGAGPDDEGKLLYLAGTSEGARLMEFDLSAREARVVADGFQTDEEKSALRAMHSEDREYGDCRLSVKRQRDPAGHEWSDIFIQCGDRPEQGLVAGSFGRSARQPALSHDGRLVLYVQVDEPPE